MNTNLKIFLIITFLFVTLADCRMIDLIIAFDLQEIHQPPEKQIVTNFIASELNKANYPVLTTSNIFANILTKHPKKFNSRDFNTYKTKDEKFYLFIPKDYSNSIRKKYGTKQFSGDFKEYDNNYQIYKELTKNLSKDELKKISNLFENYDEIKEYFKSPQAEKEILQAIGFPISENLIKIFLELAQKIGPELIEEFFLFQPNYNSLDVLLGFNFKNLIKLNEEEFEQIEKFIKSIRITTDININSMFDIFAQGTSSIFSLFNFYIIGHGNYPEISSIPKFIKISNLENLYIAGLKFSDFKKLINFFTNNIKVNFLYYISCYSGGLNFILAFIPNLINEAGNLFNVKKPNFTIATGGFTETEVMSMKSEVLPVNLKGFFDQIHAFSTDTKIFSDEELKQILIPIIPVDEIAYTRIYGNPFINTIPSILDSKNDYFRVLPLTNKEFVINNALVKKKFFEKKNIEINNKNIIFIYSTDVNVPIIITNNKNFEQYKTAPIIASLFAGISLIKLRYLEMNDYNFSEIFNNSFNLPVIFPKYFFIEKFKFKNNKFFEIDEVTIENVLIKQHKNENFVLFTYKGEIYTYSTTKLNFQEAGIKKLNVQFSKLNENNFLNAIINYFGQIGNELSKKFEFENLKELLNKEERFILEKYLKKEIN